MRSVLAILLVFGVLLASGRAQDTQPAAPAAEEKSAVAKTVDAAKAAESTKPAAAKTTLPQGAKKPAQGAKPAQEKIFILPDMGWRDVFIDPREARGTPGKKEVTAKIVGPAKPIWEQALDTLTVECIIGIDLPENLAAVVAGTRVRPGDIVAAEKLKFKVEKITKDAVHFRCVSEDEKFKRLHNLRVKKKIGL